MDSQDPETFSSSQYQYIHPIPAQRASQSLHSIPPIQPPSNFNQSNGMYPYFVDQYGSKIPVQSLLNSPILNTPMANAQIESSTKRSKKKGTDSGIVSEAAIMRKEWTKEEDVALTNAWLHISMDSDIGNNQKSTAMWVRIEEAFKENMGGRCNPPRNNNSLQCHWGKIQTAVNKFIGHYERLDRHPQSGTNVDDLINKAMGSYEDIQGSPFKYLHCWEIMIKNPKWYSQNVKPPKTNKRTVDISNSPVPEDDVPNRDEETMPSGGNNSDGLMRPQGRKGCKDKKRKFHEEKGVVDALNKLQGTLEKQVSVNITALELKKENDKKELQLKEQLVKKEIELKENAQKKKLERHIMNQDLSKLSPIARAAYEDMQANILKEWKKDGLFGSSST